ncbi:hypothetical protein BCR33DRAFT_724092 [Rhizoclosmatium globosum]|uniref:GH26 domain-containing protein n=1 Tax=Rhizoclosmatium globosum TaxID=329046 RepID=A0A1Y2B8I9_9FUNG|nr:hypothetical protein BCR33DRAFT_724092 [Rhizoclosmatium globosum]|eukprot:ORY31158.1 hypothetical protein BCR33DRAFT_724092 [Rhizoclosmatium globosum]
MNGDWMKYGRLPDQYIALWNRMGPIIRKFAPQVKIVWSPNFDLKDTDPSYWPGTQYVDMIGTSVYFKGFGANEAIQHSYAMESFNYVYTNYGKSTIYLLWFVFSDTFNSLPFFLHFSYTDIRMLGCMGIWTWIFPW